MICECLFLNDHFYYFTEKGGVWSICSYSSDGTFTNKHIESFMVCNAHICVQFDI